jgi:hypothetical protein
MRRCCTDECECDVGDAAGVQESGERCLVGECVEVNSTVVAPKTASQAHLQLPHGRQDELVRDGDKRRCSSGFLASMLEATNAFSSPM